MGERKGGRGGLVETAFLRSRGDEEAGKRIWREREYARIKDALVDDVVKRGKLGRGGARRGEREREEEEGKEQSSTTSLLLSSHSLPTLPSQEGASPCDAMAFLRVRPLREKLADGCWSLGATRRKETKREQVQVHQVENELPSIPFATTSTTTLLPFLTSPYLSRRILGPCPTVSKHSTLLPVA